MCSYEDPFRVRRVSRLCLQKSCESMKKSFLGYYRPTEDELSQLWQNCLFIVDASVLLNLYRYPKEAREDLLKILNEISERLWIPYQAALEYQENRLNVVAEQAKRYDEVRKVLKEVENKLRADLGLLQLKKRHSSIDPDGLIDSVEGLFKEFLDKLENLEHEQPDVFDPDKLRETIDSLFRNKVGAPPENQEELERIYEEGKKRYEQKRPPGYLDAAKAKTDEQALYLYGGLSYEREYGDLVIWNQIISKAKGDQNKSIILIIDDEKEDWWWKVESKGKKIIGPRPELVEEVFSKAEVSLFHMYNSERFMQFAKAQLGIEVNQESIDQVRDIAQLGKATTTIRVEDEAGNSVAGARILLVSQNGTYLDGETGLDGKAIIANRRHKSVTVFCAHNGFPAFLLRDFDGFDLNIKLTRVPRTGSIICPNGTGHIPGLEGRLNPILDNYNRLYLDATNISIEDLPKQPVTFRLNEPVRLEDKFGNVFMTKVIEIVGRSSLIEFEEQ